MTSKPGPEPCSGPTCAQADGTETTTEPSMSRGSLCEPVCPVIGADDGHLPACQKRPVRAVDFDLERVTSGDIGGMARAAVTAGAGGEDGEQIDFGDKFDEVTRSNRAGLHEVLMPIAREAGAHEDVH